MIEPERSPDPALGLSDSELNRILRKIKEIEEPLKGLGLKMSSVLSGLASLQAEQAALAASVAGNTTVVGSVVTLLVGLSTQLANVSAKLTATATEDPDVASAVAAIQQLQQTLDSNTAQLSAAVTANTPAANQPTGAPSAPVIGPVAVKPS